MKHQSVDSKICTAESGPLSLKEAYVRSLFITGGYAGDFARSVRLFIFGYLLQGGAYCCFFPLLTLAYTQQQFYLAMMWCGLMAVLCLGDIWCRWFAHTFDYTGMVVNVTHELRLKLGAKLRSMPLEDLQSYRSGELNAILTGSVEEVVLHLGVISSLLLQTLIVPAVVIVVTIYADWRLALLMLCLIGAAWPISRYMRTQAGEEFTECAQANARLEAEIVDYVQGLPVLRAVNAAGLKATGLNDAISSLRNIQTKHQMRLMLPSLLMSSIVELGFVAMLLAGVYAYSARPETGVAILAAVAVILSRFSEPLATLAHITSVVDYVETAFSNIQSLLNKKELPVTEFASPSATLSPNDTAIAFDNVSFRYARHTRNALENFSLSFPPKSLTALVGPSGSGKTTITRLLMRYADPQQGRITIGGIDIRSFTQEQLISYFSVVFQDVYLFNDTIHNNVFMGREGVAPSFCDTFVSRLPQGYATQAGDIGGILSGGERQRISIARAIVKNSPIVILDEPTAALDTESERTVQLAIDELVQNRTVVVIAHRLSTVMRADQIVVLEEGHISDVGTHEKLIRTNERYCAMWEAQQHAKQWNL